jgi:hypothetical protein
VKILELFAGSRSIGKVAETRGHEVFSVDIKDFGSINLLQDIEFLRADQIPFKPDMIWASPPCTTYSIAGIHHHRNRCQPKSEFAVKSDRIIMNTIEIIKHFNCLYYIENPVGMLRKMDFMQELPRTTITYCSYGDTRMKPTDIWSNNIYGLFNTKGWHPIPKCYNGNRYCHHEEAPRGSRTGTQGLNGDFERSKIPQRLCEEIIIASETNFL